MRVNAIRKVSVTLLFALIVTVAAFATPNSAASPALSTTGVLLNPAANYPRLSPNEASTASDAESAFADAVTQVFTQLPDDYIASEWHGDYGTITVTASAGEDARVIAAQATVPVEIATSTGQGAVSTHEYIAQVIRKLGDHLQDGDIVSVDPATGTLIISTSTAPEGFNELRSHVTAVVGTDVPVVIESGGGFVLY